MAIEEIPVKCERERRHLRILHISDLHFHSRTNPVTEMSAFETAVRRAKDDFGGAFDLIFVTGDVVDHPLTEEGSHATVLENSRTYLLQLADEHCLNKALGLVVIPGNHDYRWAGNLPDPNAEQNFKTLFGNHSKHRVYLFEHMPLLVGCFDSNRYLNGATKLEFARGAIDMSALHLDSREFEAAYRKHPRLRSIGLVHHHPLPVTAAERTIPDGQDGGILKTSLLGLLERTFKAPVEGAPEYMLLRNAGIFLHRLLENNFQLLLHGHLHEPGFWRAHTATSEGRERWIEVLSGASIYQGRERSFNTILFSPEGVADIKVHPFNAEGHILPSRNMPAATYDIVREAISPPSSSTARLGSQLYSQIWNVNLDTGDLETIEFNSKVHSYVGAPQTSLVIQTMAESLTMTQFEAWNLSTGLKISSKPRPSASEPGRIDYEIRFQPALTKTSEVDILSRYLHPAVLARNREDQELSGNYLNSPHEEICQYMIRPSERMIIKLRFHSANPSLIPLDIEFYVKDKDKNDCKDEEACGLVSFDYWRPSRKSLEGFKPMPGMTHEAVLTVFRPRLGYSYCLRWGLPSDPTFNPVPLQRARDAFYSFNSDPGKVRMCQEFLKSALAVLKPYSSSTSDISAYLFGFDNARKELALLAALGSLEPDSMNKRFRYGRDVVGATFRRCEPLAFCKADTDFSFFRRSEQDDLQYIVAFPLLHPTLTNRAVGVVAFASRLSTSALHECCNKLNEISADGNRAFRTAFSEAFANHVPS